MTRQFDANVSQALKEIVTSLTICVRIVRRDGVRVLFAQTSDPVTTIDETGNDQIFSPARGVSLATIPFELNGAATRADINIISTDGGTIDISDIENGLYDNAAVTITVISRNDKPIVGGKATGSIAFSANPVDNSRITLNGRTTFFRGFVNPLYILIGANLAATMVNMLAFLNASTFTEHHAATYALDGTTLKITAAVAGLEGNSYSLFASASPNSFGVASGPTLIGGADTSNIPSNVLFHGLAGPITHTERGQATMEVVGLLERAKQFITETFTPVCRADFGDVRCKVSLAGNNALGEPITQRCTIIGYDGGYKVTIGGLNTAAIGATGAKASGTITFTSNPPEEGEGTNPSISLNGVVLNLWAVTTATDLAYGNEGSSVIAPTLEGTLANLLNFLTHSRDPTLALMAYNVDETKLFVTAAAEGTGGNSLTISVGAATPAFASGPRLTGGFGKGNYFLNGQIIFRSGGLLNEAYEIQGSQGGEISLFTPLEFPPTYGDLIDIYQGCDHSPFAGGCARFPDPDTGLAPNIKNYRGEPWAPGDAINPCQDIPSPLPITGIPNPITGGNGNDDPDENPEGLWAPYIEIT